MKSIFSFILIVFCSHVFGQQIIKGRVLDADGNPIAHVNVFSVDSKTGITTDTVGSFEWNHEKNTELVLLFSKMGYYSKQVKLKWPLQHGAALTITLESISNELQQVTVTERQNPLQMLREVQEAKSQFIFSGKKTAAIDIRNINSNMAQKTGRQLFAKIPGAFVYDMDGSGNQINISTRGLDPHRSWEFNVRQNGVITNSDMYGYPASHYSAPMEAIDRVEMVSGTASLQYGAQFGGMINYITKKADTGKVLEYETINTVGSWGLLSTHHALDGKKGKLHYYGYVNYRKQDGYRDAAKSTANAAYLMLQYDANKHWSFKMELSHSTYQFKMPGPLTDSMFATNPRQSTRQRNWYSPDIFIPAITVQFQPSEKTTICFTSTAVLGSRSSVMFLAFANVPDTIIAATNQYKPRQVDIDNFNSYTQELKAKHQYKLLGKTATLLAGVQLTTNRMNRRQQGVGTTGSDFDLSITSAGWGRDLHFNTNNIALYAENKLQFTRAWSVSPGIRFEKGRSNMSGFIKNIPEHKIPNTINHHFALLGIGTQYLLGKHRMYAGISQAYRPIIFKDIIPASALEVIDQNLQNAHGYTAEIGMSKKAGQFRYDLSLFHINYQNRMGGILQQRPDGSNYMFKTNLGNSRTNGVELMIEYILLRRTKNWQVSIFTSTSYMQGTFTSGNVVVNNKNVSIAGNKLESVPNWMSRNGANIAYKLLSLSMQHSYVSSSYSDALNTKTPTANGAQGPVPSYHLWDMNMSVPIGKHVLIKAGVNNIFNVSYFTKRPQFYPEPGIWPSDGRSLYGTVALHF